MLTLLAALSLWSGVPVHCSAQPLPIPKAIAVYDQTHPSIYLSQPVCDRLEAIRAGMRPRSQFTQRDFAESVWVMAHEYARAHGINDQPASNCAGLTYFADLTKRLGVGSNYTRTLYGYAEAQLFGPCRAVGQKAWDQLPTS